MQFLAVFAAVPLSRASGSEFYVAAFRVVGDGVEEVFKIVESHSGNLHTATGAAVGGTGASKCRGYEQGSGCEKHSFHCGTVFMFGTPKIRIISTTASENVKKNIVCSEKNL